MLEMAPYVWRLSILHHRFSQIPLPPAGRVEVLFQIGSTTVTFRRPPKNRLVSPLDLPFREVFECLVSRA